MPYIAVNTTLSLSKAKKEEIKNELGRIITLIPGKTEEVLMIDFSDERTMYFAGKEMEKGAFIDVRCYKNSTFEANKTFTEAVYSTMKNLAGIEEKDLYLSISELPVWGTKGSLK